MIQKLTIAAISVAVAAQLVAEEWNDSNTGYTWTYSIKQGWANISNVAISDSAAMVSGEITIPSTIQGYRVSSFGATFYRNEGITGIVIPDSVSAIADNAFNGCSSLQWISLHSGIRTIGNYAFNECISLEEIALPINLTSIGAYAFARCSKLRGIELPRTLSNVGEWAFYQCPRITFAAIPDSIVIVSDWLFADCTNLANVTIPEGITTIREGAFSGCKSLRSIRLPSTLKEIGFESLYNSGLYDINIPDGVETIDTYAFAYCSSMTNAVIGAGVHALSKGTFNSCAKLECVYIGSGVTNIVMDSVSGCSRHKKFEVAGGNPVYSSDLGLLLSKNGKTLVAVPNGCENVVIPDGVESFASGAFNDCAMVTGITIPASVAVIDDAVFSGCTRLNKIEVDAGNSNYAIYDGMLVSKDMSRIIVAPKQGLLSATLPASITDIASGAFYACSDLQTVIFCNGLRHIGDEAFKNCYKLATAELPSGVTNIGNQAFQGCRSLPSVVIPNSVNTMAWHSFENCTGLTNAVFESGTVIIGGYAFKGCSKLMHVEIPDSIESIGPQAFRGSGLVDVTIGDGVRRINQLAFSGCSNLKKITFGANVQYIPDQILSGCRLLEEVVFKGGPSRIEWNAFQGCSNLASITMPDSVKEIQRKAFLNCTSLESIHLPSNLTSIGESAFEGCQNLYTLELPHAVRTIGIGAFSGCTGLASVTFPASTRSIGTGSFVQCPNLTSIIFLGNAPVIEDAVFSGVAKSCRAYVTRNSTGWGVDIPGTWRGIGIEYYNPSRVSVEVNGDAVEFETAADGKTRTGTVAAGTTAEDMKVFVGGVDVTAGFKVAVDGTTATVVLKEPYETARSASAPYQENEDGTTVTLNVEVVPGLYYAADSAATIEALRRPGAAEPAKAGDAVVAPKQEGAQGFYKVWVSDAPIEAE